MKWPEKVKYRGRLYYAALYRDRLVTYRRKGELRRYTIGKIRLPEGWQDQDRTWTAVDIYWEDKYDCKPMRERVPPFIYRMPPGHFIDKSQNLVPSS